MLVLAAVSVLLHDVTSMLSICISVAVLWFGSSQLFDLAAAAAGGGGGVVVVVGSR